MSERISEVQTIWLKRVQFINPKSRPSRWFIYIRPIINHNFHVINSTMTLIIKVNIQIPLCPFPYLLTQIIKRMINTISMLTITKCRSFINIIAYLAAWFTTFPHSLINITHPNFGPYQTILHILWSSISYPRFILEDLFRIFSRLQNGPQRIYNST